MGKVKLAVNYALMLEMIKRQGYSTEQILRILDIEDMEALFECGRGIPNWKSFIHFYETKPYIIERALEEGYQIAFLTKGTLKRLLRIKYDLTDGKDYKDKGEALYPIRMTKGQLTSLYESLSVNWVLEELDNIGENYIMKIRLYKPS